MHRLLVLPLILIALLAMPARVYRVEAANDGPVETKWGILRGTVRFDGEPPTPLIIADPDEASLPTDHHGHLRLGAPLQRIPNYQVVAQRKAPIRSERLLVDKETKGVRNALVYLANPSRVSDKARKAAARSLKFRADRCVFEPHVLAMMRGAEVLVSTEDKISYNIDLRGNGADFVVTGVHQNGEKPSVTSHPGRMNWVFHGTHQDQQEHSLRVRLKVGAPDPMLVQDNLHVWMSAWWLVLDHPYFAVTDEQGRFEIPEVPTGPQRVIVWHEAMNPRSTPPGRKPEYLFEGELVIKPDGATTKDFVLESKRVRPDR